MTPDLQFAGKARTDLPDALDLLDECEAILDRVSVAGFGGVHHNAARLLARLRGEQ